jgi:hypothetical protein
VATAAAALAGLLPGALGVLADQPNDDSDIQGASQKFGEGHGPHVGARTIPFWTGSTAVNGVTYTYTMVGADPAGETSADVVVDIVPVDVTVGGRTFRGSDVVAPVLASPLFQTADYTSTSAASNGGAARGAGGPLSTGNVDVQLLDATMRSQFGKAGTGYHLYLSAAAVHKPVVLDVPATVGTTRTSGLGVTYATVDSDWMEARVEELSADLHYLEPHRLALFLTNDVVLYVDHMPRHCCVFGAHGVTETTAEGNGSDGRQSLQTFVWSSWMTPGFFKPWTQQDINGLSHELTEWAADPFMNNEVPVWKSAIAPQYGCSNLLETGDPVVGIGFSIGSNTFVDPADPSYSPTRPRGFGDGSYHPADEAFLPWFFRSAPNTVSEPTQTASGNTGRYTFMGDLNPVWIFHQPATGC